MEKLPETPEQMVTKVRVAIRRIGQGITLVAIFFLIRELYEQSGEIRNWRPTIAQFFLMSVLALAYAAALLILAFNWLTILSALIKDPLPKGPVLLSYTSTQIAKYIPGNFLHFVGRHAYLKNTGLSHKPIATASIYEIISLPVAAIIAICLAIPFVDSGRVGSWERADRTAIAGLIVVALTVVLAVIWYQCNTRAWKSASIVISRATGFMLFQGLVFSALLYAVSGSFVVLAIPVAIMSWLVGFVTIGAPGGIGVREALLINMLDSASANENVLIAALLFRVITTVGEIVLYAFGNVFLAKPNSRGE
ncbi:hypothetical protein CLV80_105294 [Yoonia maritima]|uniref:Lysylphosphatidylglycerol synthase-like protein n=2 Tax=Yoonia maritima TaxID=1435347 RepID=A0A2T0W057_9RHOB|nr:hypothetical protein CLV80_105294 [Yoonia maritima]